MCGSSACSILSFPHNEHLVCRACLLEMADEYPSRWRVTFSLKQGAKRGLFTFSVKHQKAFCASLWLTNHTHSIFIKFAVLEYFERSLVYIHVLNLFASMIMSNNLNLGKDAPPQCFVCNANQSQIIRTMNFWRQNVALTQIKTTELTNLIFTNLFQSTNISVCLPSSELSQHAWWQGQNKLLKMRLVNLLL